MPEIPLHINRSIPPTTNPLPFLLHTPSGLALLELQGTIHFPTNGPFPFTEVGKLEFPLYSPDSSDPADTKWMKRVFFYVGKHQRLTGEVKKLAKPFAIIKRREVGEGERMDLDGEGGSEGEALEIAEVVRWKIVFSTRPEPVGGEAEAKTEAEGEGVGKSG